MSAAVRVEEHAPRPDAAAIGFFIVQRLARTLACAEDQVPTDRPFDELGLSSLDALILLGDVEGWLGVEIPPFWLSDYPTVARLADRLAMTGSS